MSKPIAHRKFNHDDIEFSDDEAEIASIGIGASHKVKSDAGADVDAEVKAKITSHAHSPDSESENDVESVDFRLPKDAAQSLTDMILVHLGSDSVAAACRSQLHSAHRKQQQLRKRCSDLQQSLHHAQYESQILRDELKEANKAVAQYEAKWSLIHSTQ